MNKKRIIIISLVVVIIIAICLVFAYLGKEETEREFDEMVETYGSVEM